MRPLAVSSADLELHAVYISEYIMYVHIYYNIADKIRPRPSC